MGPEESIRIQSNLGSTIAMAFDECPPALAERSYVQPSVDRTSRWLLRCKAEMERLREQPETLNKEQLLFGINQGGIYADIRSTELHRVIDQIEWIISGKANTTVREIADDGIKLSVNDTVDTVRDMVEKLGYDLSDEDIRKVYEEFRRIARKKTVGVKELDAIVASSALQVPSTYTLENYVINSGTIITASAQITLNKDGKPVTGISMGDGPIDAAFNALDQIIGRHFELDDFNIQTVTQEKEAMGNALVRLRAGGKIYAGTGLSTDIISASIRAYVNAVNKIVYEES